jgi:RNA polymerase primary sigma factor
VDDCFTGEVLAGLSNEPVDVSTLQRRVGGTEYMLLNALARLVEAGLAVVDTAGRRRRYRTPDPAEADLPGSSWESVSAPKSAYHGVIAEALEAALESEAQSTSEVSDQGRAAPTGEALGARDNEVDQPLSNGELLDSESVDTEIDSLRDWPEPGEEDLDEDAEGEAEQHQLDIYWSYINETHRVQLLSHREEIELGRRIREGVVAREQLQRTGLNDQPRDSRRLRAIVADGECATSELILANLRLVVSIAMRYTTRGLPRLDLIQEGNLGLIRAVHGFDHTLGFKFSTYATWWIRQAIMRALQGQARVIRIPVHAMESLRRIEVLQRMLSEDLQREPTLRELATNLGSDWSEEKVIEFRELTREAISLEEYLYASEITVDDIPTIARDTEMPEHRFEQVELSEKVGEVLSALSEREEFVLRHRLGLVDDQRTHTLEEVGEMLGVTSERVRQIESKARKKLVSSATRQLIAFWDG